MTERNRPAQRIDPGSVKRQVTDYRQALRRKGLVQLDPVQRILFQPDLPEHLGDGEFRADAHYFRRHAGHCETEKAPQRLQVEALDGRFASKNHRARSVRGL